MAPKVVVPADFGIENLHCEFHGNVVFKLQGGEDMKANSLILSYHSSVFVRLFLELNQSVLEMDDFSNTSVKSFLGALYSGEIQLDRELFRDVNKMCHVFKVDWLSRRCGDYFASLVGDVSTSTDYQTLLFLFEEARFCLKTLKCDQLLDLVVQKICSLENRVEIFVQPYMKNYTQLETSQLDTMLQITRENPVPLLTIMKHNFLENGSRFHNNDAYLLENIDICKCMHENEAVLEETFDAILESADLSRENERLVNKLYRKASRNLKNLNISSTLNVEQCSALCKESPASKKIEIVHLFISFDSFEKLTIFAFLDQCTTSPLMSNYYMFIEGLWFALENFFDHHTTSEIDFDAEIRHFLDTTSVKLRDIQSKRNWKKINPMYLSDLEGEFAGFASNLCRVTDIISQTDDSYKLFGRVIEITGSTRKILNFSDLFTKCVRLAYYLPQSASTKLSCPQSGSCGFILETEPILKDGDPFKFKASVSCDLSKYPDDLHLHPEIIKIQEMHLMLSWFEEDDFTDITKRVSYPGTLIWNGKGVQSTGCSSYPEWKIDPGYNFEPEEHVELVVFM